MKWWKQPVALVLTRISREFWRDVHEDTCAGRHCGGPGCCTCYRPPAYVMHWRHNR